MFLLCSRTFRCSAFLWLALSPASIARAGEFSLMVASPVAAGSFRAKMASFVFRSKGCEDPAKMQVRGTAEGLLNGKRQSLTLERLVAMQTPGVFAVLREWPAQGVWLIDLIADCGDQTAGALVAIGEKGIVRESSQFFPRAATQEEVESALTSFAKEYRSEEKH